MQKGILRGLFLLGSMFVSMAGALPITASDPDSPNNPCAWGLLSVLNRPTFSDSACTAANGRTILESGAQILALKGNGTGYNLPQSELRFGLPAHTEIVVAPPNFYSQSSPRATGFGPLIVGVKHEAIHFKDGVFSVEGLLTVPGTSPAFGSAKGGIVFNSLLGYSLTQTVTLACSLGIGAQSQPPAAGSASYVTVNPDLVLTWNPLTPLQFYGEAYGQTSIGPGLGPGYNADAGVQYLLTPSLEVDFEGGVRLTGDLGGFERYLGMGFGLLF